LIIESLVRDWKDWTGAKLLAGLGVGTIQVTMPIYVTEWSPANIRGAMVLTYGFWNSFGKFLPPMVLTLVQDSNPLNYKAPILTQWGFLGIMLPIFIWLPETPGKFSCGAETVMSLILDTAYYAARGEDEKGKATLRRVNGGVQGYDVDHEYSIIKNTILEEQQRAVEVEPQHFKQFLHSCVQCFRGPNLRRTIGSALPICAQQLTGLSFLNTYASLFFKQSGFTDAFLITTILGELGGTSVGSILC
jgi:MFS family permease